MKKILLLILLIPSIALSENLIRNESQSTLYAADGDTGPIASVDRYGNHQCTLKAGTAAATNPIKLEDSAHTSADAGVFTLGVRNDALNTLAADGDYIPIAAGAKGNVFTSLYYESAIGSSGPVRLEDSGIGDGNPTMLTSGHVLSAIAQTVGASGDVGYLTLDLGNRLVTTNAPAGETWQGCGTATASTADVAIKSAVASNRIYVTSITCSSSSATVATNINFKDGSTVIAVGGTNQMATTSSGAFTATFPTPLRGTSNTAFNFNTAVSTTSVICCGAGYISTI